MTEGQEALKVLIWVAGIAGSIMSLLAVAAIKALIDTRTQVAVLNAKWEMILSKVEELPKMKQDIQSFHDWKRNVNNKLQGGEI
jgi:hypothetical protein